MADKHNKQGFFYYLIHRIFRTSEKTYYGPRQVLPGIPQHDTVDNQANNAFSLHTGIRPKKQKPPAAAKPLSREKLPANLLNQNLHHNPDQGNGQDTAASVAGNVRPAFPAKPTAKNRRHKPFLKRLFQKKKKKQEEPAIKINKPGPESNRLKLRAELKPMLNSLGLYILSYLLVYTIYQFAGIIVAAGFEIDSVLYYYELYFPIGNHSQLWSRWNIIAITLVGPLCSLALAIVLLRGILPLEKPGLQARLFLLWTAYHGASHFLGAFVGGIITDLGFGYVANWLYMNVFFKILISLIFLFILVLVGYHSTRFALETIARTQQNNKSGIRNLLLSRFITPWLIGAALLIVVKIPDVAPQHEDIMVYDAVIVASMGFLVIPLLFNQKAKPRPLGHRMKTSRRPDTLLIFFISLLSLAAFRLLLDYGLHFVIRFSFDVGLYR